MTTLRFFSTLISLGALTGKAMANTEIVPINGYLPETDVSHQMALSRDKTLMDRLVRDNNFAEAEKVYTQGGLALTKAALYIKDGLQVDIRQGDKLIGHTVEGKKVTGTASADRNKGDTHIKFVYPAVGDENHFYKCNVGGLPEENVHTAGCLIEHGELETEDGTSFSYKYLLNENVNHLTLASLSTEDNKRMRPSKEEPYFESFQPFVHYFGRFDYANQIILAGYQATDTDLKRDNFYMASQEQDFGARQAVVEQGTSILSVGMNILRELEWAVYQCQECTQKDETGQGDCRSTATAMNAVDRAVAFYFGADDNFYHRLANKRCANFGTCDPHGEAMVNINVFELFDAMQGHIRNNDCLNARNTVDKITRQMWVPLIQGNLRYAWMLSDENPDNYITSKGHQAKGAIYAASILPIVYECDQVAAGVIHRNMRVRETGIVDDFSSVKQAFESCYHYLGITCDDVGGIRNSDDTDYDNDLTVACNDNEIRQSSKSSSSSSSSSSNAGRVVGFIFLVLLLIGAAAAGVYWFRSKKKTKEAASAPTPSEMPEQPLPDSSKKDAELV